MKKIVLLLLLCLMDFVVGYAQNKEIVVSAFKVVYVKLPHNYQIESIQLGMGEKYFSAKIIKENVCAIQANVNENLPPSNLSIVCHNALFVADLTVDHATTQYFYEFKKGDAINFGIVPLDENTVEKPNNLLAEQSEFSIQRAKNGSLKTGNKSEVVENEDTFIHQFDFEKDRCTLGSMSNKIGFYVSNILAEGEEVYLSFKMKNFSNLTYYCEYLQLFLTTQQRKLVASLTPEKEVLTYEKLVYKNEIKPGETTLFIIKFSESFSLTKGNFLQFIIDEGDKGRRLVEYNLSEKEFFKNVTAIQF